MSTSTRTSCLLVLLASTGAIAVGAQQQPTIHEAARAGELAKVQALVEQAPDLVASKDSNGQTPLHLASAAGRANVVVYLLSHNAGVDAIDNGGATPLHLAATSTWRMEMAGRRFTTPRSCSAWMLSSCCSTRAPT